MRLICAHKNIAFYRECFDEFIVGPPKDIFYRLGQEAKLTVDTKQAKAVKDKTVRS